MLDEFCAHTIIAQVECVTSSTPADSRETSTLDQFQAGVCDLMSDLLHGEPSPEQLEAGVASLWIASMRLHALNDRGLIDGNGLEIAQLAIAEMLTALSGRYFAAPLTAGTVDLEVMLAPGAVPNA